MGEVIRKQKNGKFIGWYLRFVDVDGKRKQRASKQPTQADARRMLIEIEARIARGKLGVPEREEPLRLTMAQLTERFLSEYDNPRIRDLTRWRQKQRYVFVSILKDIGELPISTFSVDAAERFRNRLVRTYMPNTARNKLASLALLLSWATRKGFLLSNPLQGLRQPTATMHLQFLTKEEAVRLLDVAEQKAKSSLHDASIAVAIQLGIYGGLRVGEICGLRFSDINLGAGIITVKRSYNRTTTKSGKERTIPIAPELAVTLRSWKGICPETPERLVCPCPILGKWRMPTRSPCLVRFYDAAQLPIPSAPWHILRHSFASLFMMNGGSILTLQRLLGHADIKQTQIYAHLSQDFVATEIRRLTLRG